MSGLPGRCHRVGQEFDEPLERLREVKYLLVAGDYFTKWKGMFGIPNQEAKTVVDPEKLVKEVISGYGAPEKIHSDQGRRMTKPSYSRKCVSCSTWTRPEPLYTTQSGGMVERINHSLQDILAK